MEKVIHNQTQLFLDDDNILYKYQSGFGKYYSTDTCLSYLNDKFQIGFEQGWMTGVILIDLQKAFDTIDHDILCIAWVFLDQQYSDLDYILQTGCSRSI